MTTARQFVNETNGLDDPTAYHDAVTRRITRRVPWTTPGLRIVRLRLLGERGYPNWDVSYCHGLIGDEPVDVALPFDRLPRRQYGRTIVWHAQQDGVNAKRLGVFDALSTLS